MPRNLRLHIRIETPGDRNALSQREKCEGLALEWTDSPGVSLEALLPQIVVNLVVAAEMQLRIGERHWHDRRVQRKAGLIEAERERLEEAVRKENARQRQLDNSRIEKLLQEANSLRLADDIRRYVEAVIARNAESASPVPEAQMADWSHWALEQADRIDPVRSAAFLQPVPEEKEDGPASASGAHVPTVAPGPVTVPPVWRPNLWYTRKHR